MRPLKEHAMLSLSAQKKASTALRKTTSETDFLNGYSMQRLNRFVGGSGRTLRAWLAAVVRCRLVACNVVWCVCVVHGGGALPINIVCVGVLLISVVACTCLSVFVVWL